MSDDTTKEKIHYLHYSSYVPNIVPAEDKTDDKKKVTCEACKQTLKECDSPEVVLNDDGICKTKPAKDGSNDVIGGIVLKKQRHKKAS